MSEVTRISVNNSVLAIFPSQLEPGNKTSLRSIDTSTTEQHWSFGPTRVRATKRCAQATGISQVCYIFLHFSMKVDTVKAHVHQLKMNSNMCGSL